MAFFRPTEVGLHDAWRAVNDVSPTTTLSGVGKAFPGMAWAYQGNIYQYVQNRYGGALTEGMAVSLYYGAAARLGNLTGASTKAKVVTDDTLVGDLRGSFEWPGYMFVTAGVSEGERRQIASNTTGAAGTITVAPISQAELREKGPVNGTAINSVDAFATAPDATSDYEVLCPWEVTATDIDALITSRVQGVVVSTSITDTYFGVIQLTGPAIALVDGTTDLVAGAALIPSATAGVLAKHVVTDANATTIAAEIEQVGYRAGFILGAYTTDAAGRRHVVLTGQNAIYPHPVTL